MLGGGGDDSGGEDGVISSSPCGKWNIFQAYMLTKTHIMHIYYTIGSTIYSITIGYNNNTSLSTGGPSRLEEGGGGGGGEDGGGEDGGEDSSSPCGSCGKFIYFRHGMLIQMYLYYVDVVSSIDDSPLGGSGI